MCWHFTELASAVPEDDVLPARKLEWLQFAGNEIYYLAGASSLDTSPQRARFRDVTGEDVTSGR